jgi:hypothetical protein
VPIHLDSLDGHFLYGPLPSSRRNLLCTVTLILNCINKTRTKYLLSALETPFSTTTVLAPLVARLESSNRGILTIHHMYRVQCRVFLTNVALKCFLFRVLIRVWNRKLHLAEKLQCLHYTEYTMLILSTAEHNYLVVDVCCLLHRYQLHISALMAIFRLNELTNKHRQLYLACGLYTVEGVFIGWGTRSRLYWVGWRGGGVYGFYCSNLSIV